MTEHKSRHTRRLFAVLMLFLCAAPALADGPFRFYALTPCRAVDTKAGQAPALSSGTTRPFDLRGVCGVPPEATAVALNITVNVPSQKGHLRLFPADVALPLISNINFAGGETALANGAIVPLAETGTDDIAVFTFMVNPGTTHLFLDVTGYFAPAP
jgi:hypothetical protein